MNIVEETITPEIAKEYLTHNIINRPLRIKLVESLMRDMKAGKFNLTHQGIAFDSAGNLIDGQHRLTACALANVPFTTLVARECDDVEHIDKGAKRTFTDSRHFDSESPKIKSANMSTLIRYVVRLGYHSGFALTDDEILEIYARYPKETDGIYKAFVSVGFKSRGELGAAGLAAIMCGESPEAVKDFFAVIRKGYAPGCENYNISAPMLLSKALADGIKNHAPLAKPYVYNLASNAIWEFIHGSPLRTLKSTKELRYPVHDKFAFLGGSNAKSNYQRAVALSE